MGGKFCVFIIWIITCLLASFGGVNCTATAIPAVELDALVQFKLNYIAEASAQQLLRSWDTGNASTVCESWAGITCTSNSTASGYHIQSINLGSFGLQGSIAPHLGNLTFLSTLDLSYNAFTGSIPSQLMGCTSIQVLILSSNSLISPIPPSLTSLPLLEVLELCRNSLGGPIPSALFTNVTASLRVLALCANTFTGSIPPDLGLRVPNLQLLSLWRNNLTGAIPPSLANCSELLGLDFNSNEFTGPIPAELGMLHNLQMLSLYSNALTGAIPPSLGNCSNLRDLYLSFNKLTGSIPTELGLLGDVLIMFSVFQNELTGGIPRSIAANWSSLQMLELSCNHFSGGIWEELGLQGHLRWLKLAKNNFTGEIPSSLGNCTGLISLDLGFNQLTGTIPASIFRLGQLDRLFLPFNHFSGLLERLEFGNFTNLTTMSLRNNELGGSLMPIKFSKLQQIGRLYIDSNQFTGEIPWDSLVNCTFLFDLGLSNNALSGAFPSILGRFRRLQYLDLQGNFLCGAVPDSAEYFSNLHLLELDLSHNNLNGSLPSSLAGALATLSSYLNVSHNHFSGSLPPWLSLLNQVVAMDFSNNNFTGSIPASLGDCKALVTLCLSNNHLSGDLPLQLGSLSYLQLLDLSCNNLSGVLPSFLRSSLLQLQMLNVSFNNFTGPIPTDEGVFKHLTASSFQGNPSLCGRLLNKTCREDVKQHHHHSLVQSKNWRGVLLIIFLSALVFTGLVLLALRYCFSPPPVDALQLPAEDVPSNILALHEAKRYTAKELIEATQGYSEVNLLGQGALGVVYKGVLSDGQVVAIKKLKCIDNGSEKALLREMRILSKLRHRNLVQIFGCVLNLDIKALVLQYMANGSLEQYLDMHIQSQNIDQEPDQKELSSLRYWLMVNRVATGIAQALAYLDHGYGESIIHGDVKPGNILLDSELEPHLADFGLAKIIQRGAEVATLTSHFQGSIGYIAPEYAHGARITTKVDVYSFGVVVLRMLTGKSPVHMFSEGVSLHEWVKSKLASAEGAGDESVSWEELLDATLLPRLSINIKNDKDDQRGKHIVDKESIRRLLHVGLACTCDNPKDRPTIHQVLANLTTQNTATLDSHVLLKGA